MMGRKGSKKNEDYYASRQSLTAAMLAKKKNGGGRPTITLEETKVEDIIDDSDVLKELEARMADE